MLKANTRHSSRAIVGVLMEAKLPIEVECEKRGSMRRKVGGKEGGKENEERRKNSMPREAAASASRELERYLLRLRNSLRRSTTKVDKTNVNSFLSSFVDNSLSHTQKSSHHMMFNSENPSAKFTRPCSTT